MNAVTSPATNDSNTSLHCTQVHRRHGRGHRFGKGALMIMLAIAAGFAGGFVSKAYAQDHQPMMSDADKSARMDQHVTRMTKHLAVEVDATPEQQEKMIAIVKSAAKDHESQWQPGQRRDGPQNLDSGIEHLEEIFRGAQKKAQRSIGEHHIVSELPPGKKGAR